MKIYYSERFDAKEIIARVFCDKFLLSHKKNGAPILEGEDAPFISISHSGKVTVVAVSAAKVGVDVEKIQIWERVRRKYCPETESALQFTQWWTKREAYGKWTEEGATPYLRKAVPFDGFLHINDITGHDICVYSEEEKRVELVLVS